MVLAIMSPNIMDMSLMGVDTIPRSVMTYELPKIVELVIELQHCKLQVLRIKIQCLVSFVFMGLLPRFGTLIIPCLGYRFSSVMG